MASNLPTPLSYEQILGNMLSTYASKLGINDSNVGSANTSFFETVALSTARSSGDVFQILRDFSVDRATGLALQRLAQENEVIPITAKPATGLVNVIDISFNKIATKIYAGVNPPNIGSTLIPVGDASEFPSSGSVYIGRGTPNIEGPIAYGGVSTALTGNTGINSPVISGIPSTANLLPGFTIFGSMIPAGAIIESVDSPTQITISLDATMTVVGASLTYQTPPVQVGNYWVITLNAATIKFHNLSEAVILAQGGNRNIGVNTIVIAPSVGINPSIQYTVTTAAVILDGETTVTGVPVSAVLPGTAGNCPIGAITQFASAPFAGATVTNPLPFTSGLDNETDNQLRTRIKNKLASTGLGTATAVKAAVIGAMPSDENVTVVSDSLIQTAAGATLYIDDGTGYEEKSAGVGLESIVDSALGGEYLFQLVTGGRQAPVAKAFLQSTLPSPFDLIGTDTLAVVVGGQTYQHVFQTSDFRSPGSATAYEVTASINGDVLLGFEATTAGGGTYVVIRSKTEGNDNIQITTPTTSGRDASVQMGFPASQSQTLRLYKNEIPLSEDGNTATVFTQDQALWSSTITTGDTLILAVDNTASITYTITDADFIATGLYTTATNADSLESWVEVFNAKLTGVTAEVVGQQISITSNLNTSNRAAIAIDPSSTLVSKGMFSVLTGLTSQGAASDYTLDRNTAQIDLVVPLLKGDKLAAGSINTEARIQSAAISSGSVIFAVTAYFWALIDNPGTIIPTGVVSNSLLSVSTPSANIVRYTSNAASAFLNVQPGDYVIIWSTEIPVTDRLEGRVYAITATTLDILVTPTEYASIVPVSGALFSQGFVVLRSTKAPQKFELAAGTSTLDAIAQSLQTQTDSLNFSVLNEEFLVINSSAQDINDSLMIVTADVQAAFLTLPIGKLAKSNQSLVAYYDSQEFAGQMPLFVHSGFATGTSAMPPDSYITSFVSDISLANLDPNDLICILQPYGVIPDAQPFGEIVQEDSVAGTTITIANNPIIRRLRSVDRFFVAAPLDFGIKDSMVVVLDGNLSTETFEIPLHRTATTNSTLAINSSNFNAYDSDAGPSASFPADFGSSFNFANYKASMQAKKVLKPSPSQTALLYRSIMWGSSGEEISVAYVYPSVANEAIGSTVVVNSNVTININLASGAPITSTIDGSTEWNITITPNTPSAGIDQVTYTWNSIGTPPGITLSGGEYVNISTQTEFNVANTGIFRISTQAGFTPTSTSFTVQMPHGVAVAQSNVATLVPGAINFYHNSPTTAAQINTYINANLSTYLTTTIVNDGGTTGAGVIVFSTYEDSGFTIQSAQLLDGINWIASSNISSSPQFTLKIPLSLPSDVGYAFNNGEKIILTPTTMEQVKQFISILAVSGFSTEGTVEIAERGSRLELATGTIGSVGAIQVIGGLANSYQVPILDSASRINNSLMNASVGIVAGQGITSDQWFRLSASITQKKDLLLSSNTSVTIINNSPLSGQSTIQLLNRQLDQRYFGAPRSYIRSQGDTFRIEQQGNLTCLSWNPNSGTSPGFQQASLNFNDSGGGTVNVFAVPGTNNIEYTVLTGNANFSALSIGDLLTVAGMPYSQNNGTFLVTGISSNGTQVEVLNSNAVNQFSHGTFTLNTNSTAGDTFTIGAINLIAGTNFAIGLTAAATATNLSAVIGTVAGVTSSVSGTVVTVTANTPAANIAISYSGVGSVTVSGSHLVGDSFVAGNFSAAVGVSEGDTLIISAPFNVLNQGKFRVIRSFSDSVWFENPDSIEEEVLLPYNPISIGFDATTSFNVNASNNDIYLSWNGTGTEPNLGNAQVGDIVTFGTDFNSANQGSFMVIGSGPKLQEITNFTMPTGAQFTLSSPGAYFLVNSASNLNQYYVWFNVNGTNSDPAPVGPTGLQVNILSGDTSTQVAAKTAAILNVATGLSATSSGGTLIVTTTGFGATTDASNVSMPAPFSVTVMQQGRTTFLEAINPSAVTQASVLVTGGILQVHRPQLQFFEYEATVPGDTITLSGNSFGASNAGTYSIVRTIDRNNVAIGSLLAPAFNVSLNGNVSSLFVSEEYPYYGYKRVVFAVSQPGAPTRTLITFDTNGQYDKVNQASGVQMLSLNKLNFSTIVKNGLDSYKYNTGLIAECNRIIYGDPRDPITYPGVGAAGADIFIRSPLSLRIQLSLDIRLNTGVPFIQTVQQVRNAVSALINSNPVGQSIAISSILSNVGAIPGILAVSIDSPLFNSANDLIILTPSQKAVIIDPTTDISVSQIGV
jgi:uncharacterized phage protein gp47/JayE